MDTGTSFNLFSGELASFDPIATLNPYVNSTTPIGGAYDGFLGGVVNATTKDVGVLFRAFYLDPDGNFGLLYPADPITGTANLEAGMWKAEGDIAGYQLLAATGLSGLSPLLSPQNFVSAAWREGKLYHADGGVGRNRCCRADSSTAITLDVIESTNITLPAPLNNKYQLGLNVIGGTYSGTPLSWTWQIDTPTPNPMDTSWIVPNITAPVNNVFTGTVVEAHVNWEDARTYVQGGDIKGIFNPTTSTWKAVGVNFQMETGEFMNKLASMTTDAQKEAFYKATKIPCVEIGRTNLTGTGSGSGWSIDMSSNNYGMKDVVFLAPTSGARPQIWATGTVAGGYTGAPTAGATVPLTGGTNGVTANFQVQNWNNTTWGATVNGQAPNGIGTYNQQLNFTGGAAGMIKPATNSFSGTAAGVVKPK